MKKLTLTVALVVLLAMGASAQMVQISDTRDVDDKFTAWVDLTVAWDATTVADVPDPSATDDDSLQEWYINVSGGWRRFTFERTKLGEYAVRWSSDGSIWSLPGVCKIELPEPPKHVD